MQTLWGSGEPVDVSEIEALCDLLPDAGIFKLKPKLRGNGHSGGEYAVHDEPVNVDARFAEMQFEGPGDSAVHQTELHVAASLLRRGMSVKFTVLTVLEETQKALLNDPRTATWDWGAERLSIEKKCYAFVQKNPDKWELPTGLRETFERKLRTGENPILVHATHIGWHVRPRPPGRAPGTKPKAHTTEHIVEAPAGEIRKYQIQVSFVRRPSTGVEPLYLVDELIPVAGLVDVWGKAKCYKSFWTLDLMLHVAMGWEYRDRYVHQGAVVYCAFEGAHGYKKRVEALSAGTTASRTATNVPLYVMPGQANLIAEHRLL